MNDITNWFDWPLDAVSYNNYLKDKYGDNIDGVHHYEVNQTSGNTTVKLEVSSDTSGATIVTNREYEDRLQDEKRQIRLLDVNYLGIFVEEFKKIIKR